MLLVVAVIEGCSVSRRGPDTEIQETNEIMETDFLRSVINNNITNNNFFIQKGEIDISDKDVSQKIYASLKFIKPDTMLLSIRSRAGIEALRFFMTSDTIMINDRINRKLLLGNPEYLDMKYGIATTLICILFGDLLIDNLEGKDLINCINGNYPKDSFIRGRKIRYVIDCEKRKIVSARIEGSMESKKMEINYKKFQKAGSILIPGIIEVEDPEHISKISIRIDKIEIDWKGTIEFIPGNRYEVIHLL